MYFYILFVNVFVIIIQNYSLFNKRDERTECSCMRACEFLNVCVLTIFDKYSEVNINSSVSVIFIIELMLYS